MEQTREELSKKLFSLRKEIGEVREKLDSFDYEERLSKVNKLLGKCFIESDSNIHDGKYITCLYIYNVEKDSCSPESIRIVYYTDSDIHFQIEYYYHFDIDEDNNYSEITKEEFMVHYNEVQKRISNALNKKD